MNTRRNILNGLSISFLIGAMVLGVVELAEASVTANYVNDPSTCPTQDGQFPGQKCPTGTNICGANGSDIPQCYDTSTISAPTSTGSSNTQYTASLGGGFIIDCFAQPLDSAAPYCDNNGSALCNRDASCYSTQYRDTSCTPNVFGAYSCGDCRSGYQDCAGDSVCEVTTGSTNYPTGANNNYAASCAAQCDSGYLDCDSGGAGSGDGCEILNGGSCGTNAVYDGCSGGSGNCQCSSGYNDCDSSGASAGNGCEIQTGAACTTAQGASGTYSSCTCVPTASDFRTGVLSVYATSGALLQGQNLGTGNLIEMTGAGGAVFKVFESGALQIGTYEGESGTGAGTMRWTGTDFEGFNGSSWLSLTTGGISQSDADSRYVNVSGDTMTGDLILSSGASLNISGALLTNSNLTINSDNGNTDAVLTFGNDAGAETLMFNNSNNRFEFTDDVYIDGSLTTTGLINGIDLATLSSSTDTQLKVSSGAGLTVSVAAGSYRINSVITNYAGSGSVSLSDSTTTYLYLTSTGLTLDTIAVPNDKSYIPLASVVTAGGGVSSISDLRVLNSDDRERTTQQVFHPQFANAALQGDGSNNVGQLYVNHDDTSKNNFYFWTSTITSLQNYDVIVRVTVPPDFKNWVRNPLSVAYRSSSADTANNKMDISVVDTAGSAVTLSGSTTSLAGTSWGTTNIAFQGSPTWTAGGEFLIKFKMYAKSGNEMHLGTLKVSHVEFQSSP